MIGSIPPELLFGALRRACLRWPNAPRLVADVQALEAEWSHGGDAVIGKAKAAVETVARTILADLGAPGPVKANPTMSEWLGAALDALGLKRGSDRAFQKLISQHNSLADVLNELRAQGDPASHGRPGFDRLLAEPHRRMACLAADALILLLLEAVEGLPPALRHPRALYDEFDRYHQRVDSSVGIVAAGVDDQGDLKIVLRLPDGTDLPLEKSPSELLFHLDREAYVAAYEAALAQPEVVEQEEEEALGGVPLPPASATAQPARRLVPYAGRFAAHRRALAAHLGTLHPFGGVLNATRDRVAETMLAEFESLAGPDWPRRADVRARLRVALKRSARDANVMLDQQALDLLLSWLAASIPASVDGMPNVVSLAQAPQAATPP